MINKYALAACLAASNLGMEISPRKQKYALSAKTLQEAVVSAMGEYIESEDMEKTFLEEAESWYDNIKNLNDNDVIQNIHNAEKFSVILYSSIQPKRRHKLEKGLCEYCDSMKSDFHPSHDASPNCQSGKGQHCSCDTCF